MSDPEMRPCLPTFGLPHTHVLTPALGVDLPTWHPAPELSAWHRPDRVTLLLQRVMAVVRRPIEAVVHRGRPAWRIAGLGLIRQAADGQIAGELWVPRDGQMQLLPIPDDQLAIHPSPVGLRWLDAIVEAYSLELSVQVQRDAVRESELDADADADADDEADDAIRRAYLEQLRGWLVRQLRRHADLRSMRRQVAQALALDADTLRLTRHTVREVIASDGHVTAAAWNVAVAHRAGLCQVRFDAPQLLPLYGAFLADSMLPAHPPHDAVRVLKQELACHGIDPALWRLIHRSPARLALLVRQAYRGSRAKAMIDFFLTLQEFDLRETPEPEVLHACWAQEGNDHYRWETYARQISPQARCYGHVARLYAQRKALTLAPDRAQLRLELEQVVHWIDIEQRARFSKPERRGGWRWLVRQAHAAQAEQRAEMTLTKSWEVPAPFDLGDLRFVPLGSDLALWEEGVAMRHCAFDRRFKCELGHMVVVSIQRHAEAGRPAARVATAQYDRQGDGWVLKSVLGAANRVAPEAVQRAAQKAVSWIAGADASSIDDAEVQADEHESADSGDYDCGVEGCCRPYPPYQRLCLFSDLSKKHLDKRSDPTQDRDGLPCEGYMGACLVAPPRESTPEAAGPTKLIWFKCDDGTLVMEGVKDEYEYDDEDEDEDKDDEADDEENEEGEKDPDDVVVDADRPLLGIQFNLRPPTWSGHIAAMRWFEDLSRAQLREVGVRIVDGEMPGSSYCAAELRVDIAQANEAAERLGLACRFKGAAHEAPGGAS